MIIVYVCTTHQRALHGTEWSEVRYRAAMKLRHRPNLHQKEACCDVCFHANGDLHGYTFQEVIGGERA